MEHANRIFSILSPLLCPTTFFFPPPLYPLPLLSILRFAGVVTISLGQSNCKSLLLSEFVGRQQQTVLQGARNENVAEDLLSVLSYLSLDGRVRVHDDDFGAGDDGDTLSEQSEEVMQVLEKAFTRNQ